MKTTTQQIAKFRVSAKITLSIALGSLLILSIAFGKQIPSGNQLSLENKGELNLKLDKGSYLTSDFLKFKKENLRDDLFSENTVSDKVLFRAFVNSKEANRSE